MVASTAEEVSRPALVSHLDDALHLTTILFNELTVRFVLFFLRSSGFISCVCIIALFLGLQNHFISSVSDSIPSSCIIFGFCFFLFGLRSFLNCRCFCELSGWIERSIRFPFIFVAEQRLTAHSSTGYSSCLCRPHCFFALVCLLIVLISDPSNSFQLACLLDSSLVCYAFVSRSIPCGSSVKLAP